MLSETPKPARYPDRRSNGEENSGGKAFWVVLESQGFRSEHRKGGFSGQRIIVRGDRRNGSEKTEDRIGGVNGGFFVSLFRIFFL